MNKNKRTKIKAAYAAETETMMENQKNFKPYIPAEKITPEITVTSIIMGIILAVVFGAANAYLGLRVGMTVSASIPAAASSTTIQFSHGTPRSFAPVVNTCGSGFARSTRLPSTMISNFSERFNLSRIMPPLLLADPNAILYPSDLILSRNEIKLTFFLSLYMGI